MRFADGSSAEGRYVDGKRHGDWVIREKDGKTWIRWGRRELQ